MLDPWSGVHKLTVSEREEGWGFIEVEGTDWEMKWWKNGTVISEHPTLKHIGVDGGDFRCEPNTGAFYISWKN